MLTKPWPLHTHDFTPTPPPIPTFVSAPVFVGEEVVVRAEAPHYWEQLEQDEEVDLWAEGVGS